MKMITTVAFGLLMLCFFSCTENKKQVNLKEEEGRISGAYDALNFLSNQRMYPNDQIPSKAYFEANKHIQKNFVKAVYKNGDEEWQSLGPHNIGGRTLALAINPENTNTIYAGSASGGLWRSRTAGLGGEAWEQVSINHPVLGVSSIAIAPQDTNVMYIGTGEVYNYQQAGTSGADRATRGSYGMGILKTEDGGNSWTKSLDWSYNSERGIQVVKINPQDENCIWAGTTEGTYKSTDAGENWVKVHDIKMVMDLAIHPTNPNIVLLGCGNFASEGFGIYRTEDGGETWTHLTENLPDYYEGKIMIDFSLSNPEIVYASIGNGFSQATGASWLCRSEDAGETWEVVTTVDYSKWQGWFAHDVAVHPENPDEIMVVGIDIWKSIDGGITLNQVTDGGVILGVTPIDGPDGPSNFSHSDHHAILYDVNTPGLIYFANDGGIYVSEDGGNNFASRNGAYQTTQFYNGNSNAPYDSLLFMGGLQDNSTAVYFGDLAWGKILGGDGAYAAFHPTDEDLYYAGWQQLGIGISTNQGANFNYVTPPNSNLPTAFIAPYHLAPTNPDIMYAGRSRIYRSENGGQSWTTTNNGNDLDGNPALSIGISHQDENVVYVATAPYFSKHSLFVTQDGGDTWNDVSSDILPDRYPMDLVVDPKDGSVAYVVYSGFGTPHLFKTENFGADWEPIGDILPDVPTSAVLVDEVNSDIIYVGNDIGVFATKDGGDSWQMLDDGLPNPVMVMDLSISTLNQKLRVGTHGNGAYQRPVLTLPEIVEIGNDTIYLDTLILVMTDTLFDTISTTIYDTVTLVEVDTIIQYDTIAANINSIPQALAIKVFPNPMRDFATFEYTLKEAGEVSLNLLDATGKQVESIKQGYQNAGQQQIKWNRNNLPNGVYFFELMLGDNRKVGKIILQ